MVMQAFLPMLIEAKGVVINKSPLAGCPSWAVAFQGMFNSSEHVANSISDGMRVEPAPFDVRVAKCGHRVYSVQVLGECWQPYNQGVLARRASGEEGRGEYIGRISPDVHGCRMCMQGRRQEMFGDPTLRLIPLEELWQALHVASYLAPYWVTDWVRSQPAELWRLRTSQDKK